MNCLKSKSVISLLSVAFVALVIFFNSADCFAQSEAAKVPPPSAPMSDQSFFGNTLMFMVAGFLGYFMIVTRPQQMLEQEKKKILESLKKNDSVLVGEGIYGKIVQVQDGDAVIEIGTAGTSLKIKAQASSLKLAASSTNQPAVKS
jgi:preprotein translocase subunit YajC